MCTISRLSSSLLCSLSSWSSCHKHAGMYLAPQFRSTHTSACLHPCPTHLNSHSLRTSLDHWPWGRGRTIVQRSCVQGLLSHWNILEQWSVTHRRWWEETGIRSWKQLCSESWQSKTVDPQSLNLPSISPPDYRGRRGKEQGQPSIQSSDLPAPVRWSAMWLRHVRYPCFPHNRPLYLPSSWGCLGPGSSQSSVLLLSTLSSEGHLSWGGGSLRTEKPLQYVHAKRLTTYVCWFLLIVWSTGWNGKVPIAVPPVPLLPPRRSQEILLTLLSRCEMLGSHRVATAVTFIKGPEQANNRDSVSPIFMCSVSQHWTWWMMSGTPVHRKGILSKPRKLWRFLEKKKSREEWVGLI